MIQAFPQSRDDFWVRSVCFVLFSGDCIGLAWVLADAAVAVAGCGAVVALHMQHWCSSKCSMAGVAVHLGDAKHCFGHLLF